MADAAPSSQTPLSDRLVDLLALTTRSAKDAHFRCVEAEKQPSEDDNAAFLAEAAAGLREARWTEHAPAPSYWTPPGEARHYTLADAVHEQVVRETVEPSP